MFQIESKTIPARRYGKFWPEIRATLSLMKEGSDDSFFVPDQTFKSATFQASISTQLKKHGLLVITRKEPGGIRVWRKTNGNRN